MDDIKSIEYIDGKKKMRISIPMNKGKNKSMKHLWLDDSLNTLNMIMKRRKEENKIMKAIGLSKSNQLPFDTRTLTKEKSLLPLLSPVSFSNNHSIISNKNLKVPNSFNFQAKLKKVTSIRLMNHHNILFKTLGEKAGIFSEENSRIEQPQYKISNSLSSPMVISKKQTQKHSIEDDEDEEAEKAYEDEGRDIYEGDNEYYSVLNPKKWEKRLQRFTKGKYLYTKEKMASITEIKENCGIMKEVIKRNQLKKKLNELQKEKLKSFGNTLDQHNNRIQNIKISMNIH